MGAENFNFAPHDPQDKGSAATNFEFLEESFSTRKKFPNG